MLYLVQTSISKKKRLDKALCEIYGIGPITSESLCQVFGIQGSCKVYNLRRNSKKRLKAEFSEFPRQIGTDLKNFDKARCQNLIDIQSYRGRRHKFGYPVRGQRTHTNGRTQKKLYIRWSSLVFEKSKTKIYGKQIKITKIPKSKKSKTLVKPKPKKTGLQKAAKYKIS